MGNGGLGAKNLDPLGLRNAHESHEKTVGVEHSLFYESFHQVCAADDRTAATALLKLGSDVNELDEVSSSIVSWPKRKMNSNAC